MERHSALLMAVHLGHADVVACLVGKADPYAICSALGFVTSVFTPLPSPLCLCFRRIRDRHSRNSVMLAAAQGSAAILRLLLAQVRTTQLPDA